jgi:phosphonatase-like hydrolase
MQAEPKLVVFDMAGTTIRDTGHIPDAFITAFARHGLNVSAEQVATVRGASKRHAVQQLVVAAGEDDTLADEVYRTFREELVQAFARGGIHAVEGAQAIFAGLRNRGVRVALNTGLDREIVMLLTAALGWTTGVVDVIVAGDDVRRGRPAPDLIERAMTLAAVSNPADVANVGDTALDVQAGRQAGVRWNIAVCSGAHDRATLEREHPTHVIRSVADLYDVLF